MTDAATTAWTRNASDERAAANGCRFDAGRGAYVVWWVERYCRLYEGECAGQPLELKGCLDCGDYGLPHSWDFDAWDDDPTSPVHAAALERARRHCECLAAGHRVSWQYDCTMRLFGWVRFSERWQREVRRFRQGSLFLAKKNCKSPTLAAWGLYLLCGDGEPGQKVFFGAKDGQQARKIAGEHAAQMVLRSPELSDECGLNRSTMRISHRPTTSFLEPLSSSNSRTQESKEGLNGSVLIDEVHVVDRDFVRRISRAGISRSEPLQLEVSTAGNNPDGYGKERFDHALRVERGEAEDQGLFAAVYAAPQDLSDADLDADPLRYGRMANPAMGHTVDPQEFLTDYRQSKAKGISALLDFKMYRLNVWQRASSPWLRAADWARCYMAFAEDDLAGRDCWAALDLSRTRDMSALVLVFRGDAEEEYLLLPYFWLPEGRADEIEHLVPGVRAWARDGHLTLTPGDVIDYGFVKSQFRRLAARFNVLELAYDPRFAEELTQTLEQGQADDRGRTVEEGTGVPRFAFAQNDANYGAPTEDFERLVIAGKMRHNGHPVLAWQAGHAAARKSQFSGVKRVLKPRGNDVRTVDGVQAGIMALARASAAPAPATPSVTWI